MFDARMSVLPLDVTAVMRQPEMVTTVTTIEDANELITRNLGDDLRVLSIDNGFVDTELHTPLGWMPMWQFDTVDEFIRFVEDYDGAPLD